MPSLEINVLASSSRGNSIMIRSDNTAVLLDAGISARRITNCLKSLKMDLSDLDAVLLTHEHSDHIKGLKTLLKKQKLPVFTRAKTFKAMNCLDDIPPECCHVIASDTFTVGSLNIRPFSISHDAADPVGYTITDGRHKITSATDLGFVSEEVKEALDGADALVLEANHDVNMLQNGMYPWQLKQRILGRCGHLSNFAAGMAITQLRKQPENIILAHLSEKNNLPALAANTIYSLMKKYRSPKIPLHVSSPDEITTVQL